MCLCACVCVCVRACVGQLRIREWQSSDRTEFVFPVLVTGCLSFFFFHFFLFFFIFNFFYLYMDQRCWQAGLSGEDDHPTNPRGLGAEFVSSRVSRL